MIISLTLFTCDFSSLPDQPAPVIEKRGEAVQLIVDGKPFLVMGGELHNSSSSSREYMKDIWPKLERSGMNTVLAAVEWALVEPGEGKFDFSVVDALVKDARKHNLRLALLWFGAWKNGQSHYAPDWVKKDYTRFPRVRMKNGKSLEILSPFSTETLDADSRAFSTMMKHIRAIDSAHRTVIMLQVQNEMGVLGSTRDYSQKADSAYYVQVPRELTDYLTEHKDVLLPELHDLWSKNGYKTSGTWDELFGTGNCTDEIFMAWQYARYIDHCAKQAKEAYNLPMFVNAWIVQPQDEGPGDYPSGGPQAHVLDLWRAGAPNVDLYCPDIYLPDFAGICELYTRRNNTLFIPESRAGERGAGQLYYAIGRHNAIGYSPFGYENRVADPDNGPIPKSYKLLSGMTPVILEAQSKGSITAVLLKKRNRLSEEIEIGGYRLLVEMLRSRYSDSIPAQGYGIIIHSGPDEFIIAGKDIQVSFSPVSEGPAIAGIAHVDEGKFVDGEWIPRRRLNGDAIMIDYDLAKKAGENKTGTGLKFSGEDRNIQKVKLYRYE